MSRYIYTDEDNAPMNDDAWDGPHNPTVYLDRAEMKAAEEALPFTDPPPDGCWNCSSYDGDHCTAGWNNGDPAYYVDFLDDKNPDDKCEMWTVDESVRWEDR